MVKAPDAFRTISEVSEALNTPAHVLRFWESKFSQIKPVKRAGGRRYYRPDDISLLAGIKFLLHEQGMTIKGAQKLLRENGVKHVAGLVGSPINLSAEPEPEMPKIRVIPRVVKTKQENDDSKQPSLFVDEKLSAALHTPELDVAKLTVPDATIAAPARFFGAKSDIDEDHIRENVAKIAPLIARLEAVQKRMRMR